MLFLLIYLPESIYFSKKILQEYTNKKSSKSPETLISPHYMASPSFKSKFTPSNEAATPSVSRKLKINLKDLEKVESTKRKNPVVQSKNENMIEEEDSDEEEEVHQEGFLYKITETTD